MAGYPVRKVVKATATRYKRYLQLRAIDMMTYMDWMESLADEAREKGHFSTARKVEKAIVNTITV